MIFVYDLSNSTMVMTFSVLEGHSHIASLLSVTFEFVECRAVPLLFSCHDLRYCYFIAASVII